MGLPLFAAAAYVILSRLGSRPLVRLASLERTGGTPDSKHPAHTVERLPIVERLPTVERLSASKSVESRQEQLDTVVTDFADDRLPFRIVGQTYHQQQTAREGEAREQNREILRKILDDNVSLRAEIAARRTVG
ncbi:MAG: hypothetical protein ACYSWU_13275 [Planctomycetota bacterium]